MSLREQLNADLRNALRAGDEKTKTTIRVLLSSVHNAEIEQGHELEDDAILGVVGREIKLRRDSIEEFRKASRNDLIAKAESEVAVLSTYLPEQMSRDEVVAAAKAAIQRTGA